MLEESQVSICFPSARFSQFDQQYESFLEFVKQVCEYLSSDEEINHYLQKIDLTSSQLLQEYRDLESRHT